MRRVEQFVLRGKCVMLLLLCISRLRATMRKSEAHALPLIRAEKSISSAKRRGVNAEKKLLEFIIASC